MNYLNLLWEVGAFAAHISARQNIPLLTRVQNNVLAAPYFNLSGETFEWAMAP